jgi:hypothetical protein
MGIVFAMVGATPSVEACTIVVVGHRSEFRASRAVFLGTVVSVLPGERGLSLVKLRVDKRWKGPNSREMEILSDQGQRCGGPRFEAGKQYLVYARHDENPDGPLEVPASSRSKPAEFSGASEREFRQLDSLWFRLRSRLF